MKCETVKVTLSSSFNVTTHTIPAYTRSYVDMKVTLDTLVTTYLERSRIERSPVSLGDFALFAVSQAAKEPKEI